MQILSAQPEEGPVTLSCIVRTQQPIGRLTLEAGTGIARHFAPFDTAGKWETVSVSGTVAAGANRWVAIGPRNTDLTPASVDVKACWLTHTSTPGRACWGGEAPVTCAADRHTISTEGWPTEAGEISVTFSPGPSDTHQYIIDGRAPGDTTGKTLLLVERLQKRLRFDIVPGQAVTGPILEVGRWYVTKIVVRDGRTRVLLDGVEVINVEGTPQFALTATIGNRFEQDEPLNGSISSLRVRSFE